MKHLMTVALFCGFIISVNGQTWNPDADYNNLIGLNDLLSLLTVYGNEWTVDMGQDSEFDIAAYYVGEIDLIDCIATCKSNNAAVMSVDEYALFQDSVDVATGLILPDDICSDSNDDYYYGYFYRSMHCRNDSDFGYGQIRRGGTYECSYTDILNFGPGTSFFGVTTAYTYHCVCSGLVPSPE